MALKREEYLTEAEIALAIAGDRGAVAELVRRFLPRVHGLALRLVGRDLAEEATQETFVRALRALPGLREPGALAGWLLTIAANTARELGQKKPTRVLDFEPEARPEPPRADERVARSAALERAVACLDGDDRELFFLHTVEGVSLSALALSKKVSPEAMKSRVHRVRTKVRRLALDALRTEGGAP